MTIVVTCPVCNETDTISLTGDQYDRYLRWQSRELLIQDALPELSPDQREQLKTGICAHCWKEMFENDEAA